MGQTELWTRTALVVEDDEVMARLVQFILESERYCVQRVPDGFSARKLIENDVAPDLVTLDLLLPDTTGLELLATIRATPDWKHVPVLLLSADLPEFVELASTGDDAGTTTFMEKPFRAADLRAHISRLLNETALPRVTRAATPRCAAAGRRH
jgi:DNA-binding response OmpR family regulator